MKYIQTFEGKVRNDPFVQAAKRGSNNKVKEFIKQGVDVNKKNIDTVGNTALMEASLNRFLLVVQTLLDAGADPNIQNAHGRTALMMSSTEKIDNLLLEHGANVNIQNVTDGETALMERLNYGLKWDQIIVLIEKYLNYGLDLDIKNKKGHNFYEMLMTEGTFNKTLADKYPEVITYMDDKFPKYGEEWRFKKDVKKYNL